MEKQTTDSEVKNSKIMVNFKTQKVINTDHHEGSREYHNLVMAGYQKVGTTKTRNNRTLFYWEPEFFDPQARYILQDLNRLYEKGRQNPL
jgi:hypothetical protein